MFFMKLFMSAFLSCTIVWAVAQEGPKRSLPDLLEGRPWLALPLIGLTAALYWLLGLVMKDEAVPSSRRGPGQATAVPLRPKPSGPDGPTSAEAERLAMEDHVGYGR